MLLLHRLLVSCHICVLLYLYAVVCKWEHLIFLFIIDDRYFHYDNRVVHKRINLRQSIYYIFSVTVFYMYCRSCIPYFFFLNVAVDSVLIIGLNRTKKSSSLLEPSFLLFSRHASEIFIELYTSTIQTYNTFCDPDVTFRKSYEIARERLACFTCSVEQNTIYYVINRFYLTSANIIIHNLIGINTINLWWLQLKCVSIISYSDKVLSKISSSCF